MNKKIRKAYKRIKSLEVQGATDVAIFAVDSLRNLKDKKELEEATKYLEESRPNEPLMRNGFKFIKERVAKGKQIDDAVKEYKGIVRDSVAKITDAGMSFMFDGVTIFTHCRSSLVENIILKAHEKGKIKRVIVTETRPLYQGRKTARRLSKEGVPVTLCVDSARISLLKSADLAIVGADVITSKGEIFNKVGTKSFALATEYEAPMDFLVASQLLKFDPRTLKGNEKIEERKESEVWKKPPKGVEIRNPAFDIVPPEQIDYMVTEEGVINPFNVVDTAKRVYPWIFEEEGEKK